MNRRQFVRMTAFGIVCVELPSLLGCGGGNGPTGPGPSEPPEMQMTFLAERTGSPVVGALIEISGKEYRTDSSGVARDDSSALAKAFKDDRVEAIATGFRQPSSLRAKNNVVWYLWEADKDLPSEYTDEIVYNIYFPNFLNRPVAHRAVLAVEPAMWAQTIAQDAVLKAVAMLNEADSDIEWSYSVGEPPNDPAILGIKVHVDPNDPAFKNGGGAAAYIMPSRHTILGGRIVISTLKGFPGPHLPRAIAHESAHIRGMGHSDEGMMGSPTVVFNFSDMEREIMRKMFRRPPGTSSPDDSTTGSESSGAASQGFSFSIGGKRTLPPEVLVDCDLIK